MAWAEKLPSGRWRGVYRDQAGKRRSAGVFPRKSDAVREANTRENNVRENPSSASDSQTLTWAEWLPEWKARRAVLPGTAEADETKIRAHLLPQWGTYALSDITPDLVQRWVLDFVRPTSEGGKGLKPNTAIKCYWLLSSSLRIARRAGLISTNPCEGVDLPKPGPMPERYLEDREIEAIRQPLEPLDQLLFDILIGTGARLGEGLALHWESVDLDRMTVEIAWSFDRNMRNFKSCKGHASRTIPIGETLAEILSEERKRAGIGKPTGIEYRGSRTVHSGLVVAQPNGRPLDDGGFRARFNAAVRIAYIGTGKNRHHVGNVRIHDLRHTYASRLLRAGVPLVEVSRLLGHASVQTTMRYAHLADSNWSAVRGALK